MRQSHSEWTFYQPPKSQGFGQVATPRAPRAAWQVLEAFIEDHAVANEWLPTGLTIDACPEFWTPNALEGALASLTSLEGKPNLRPRVTHDSQTTNILSWFDGPAERRPLNPQTLFTVLDLASRLPKSKIQWRYPIRLSFGFEFFWRGRYELQTPPVRVGRQMFDEMDWGPGKPYSSLAVSISDHLLVQPLFLFPYEWGSAALAEMLAEISPKLPIKFRPNHFRRAVVNKRGDAFKLLKIAAKKP